jgi:molybdopterin molybdotransferase
VSVFVSIEVFLRPAILRMMGRTNLFRPEVTATLTEEVRGPRGKLQFARVEVRRDQAGWSATPTGARGSNLISTVARANGLAMIPAGNDVAPAGSTVKVLLFRSSED